MSEKPFYGDPFFRPQDGQTSGCIIFEAYGDYPIQLEVSPVQSRVIRILMDSTNQRRSLAELSFEIARHERGNGLNHQELKRIVHEELVDLITRAEPDRRNPKNFRRLHGGRGIYMRSTNVGLYYEEVDEI